MAPPDDNPGVIAPPPLIYLAGLIVGNAIEYVWPAPFLPQAVQYSVGGSLIVAGLALAATAMRLFSRAGTNLRPDRPSTALVFEGPYRFSRNPMYISLTMTHLGIAIAADSVWMIAMVIPVLITMNLAVIAREERYLEGKFGDDYRRFKQSVRRWL